MIYNQGADSFYVYLIECADGSFYTGTTDDILKRYEEHITGIDENCETFGKWPLKLRYYETISSSGEAAERQNKIAALSKEDKLLLVERNGDPLPLLAVCNAIIRQNTKGIKKEVKKAGILGGGQLGRMLLQAAANYPVETFLMENDPASPAAHLCHHFVKGDIANFEDVYNFGKGLDAITIEIESVNEDALLKLENEGVKIFPSPAALKIIKNKVLQKQFYKENGIPSSDFVITKNLAELSQHQAFLPAVHKIGVGGYDGRGVQVMKTKEDFTKGFDSDAVLEKMVDIKKEIAIIIAVGQNGDTNLYPPVDMVFDPRLNLLEYQVSPADLPEKILWKIEAFALKVVKHLNSPGIFAIELFVDSTDHVWVNETAPRVHNSGHHTIEANFSSQFDMLWRIILGYPLGSTEHILPAAIVNLLGAPGHEGEAYYEGLPEIMQLENVFVHIYGKKETRPGRKMGHITILSKEKQELIHQANRIKQTVRVVSKD
ncbi:MAG: 5-(carboxyamino)imidazole ribonucleotide synthase [Ferruginibacter sp.]